MAILRREVVARQKRVHDDALYKSTDTLLLTRASNAGGVGKNRDSRRIFGDRMDDWYRVRTTTPYSLPHRPPRISDSCLSQPAWTTTTKRREQHIIICTQRWIWSGSIANNRRLCATYCTIEVNWQTWSIARPLCDSMATCLIPLSRLHHQVMGRPL